ncbi:acetylornithine deacetylase [Donghicola tyrosinivorans]|nr:acetylornithine deacetylase [Donghicola tyrosinivorans]
MNKLSRVQATLADLIAFPTISVDSNLQMMAYLEESLTKVGARVTLQHDATGKKANLWASLGPEVDGGVILSGHSDVVPVEDQDWTTDPFTLVEKDGLLYGRGTCDMKGFIAACIALAPDFAKLDLKRPIHFAFTYDEETACLGAQALVKMLAKSPVKPAIALIGEPTEMRVIEGHKGCCEYTTRFTGLEGHGSNPNAGVNAVEYAVLYVSKLLELREGLKSRAPEGSRFDPPWTTINIGGLHGGVAHNVIVGKAEVDWEFRPVQATDYDYVTTEITRYATQELLPKMQAIHPEAAIHTETLGEVAGLEPMEINAARDLLAELTGANSADVVSFGTEAGLFQSIGIDAVVCGPGSIAQAHKPDEFVAKDQLAACIKILEGVAHRLTQ